MKRLIQHEPLHIQQLDQEKWSSPVHTHNHFKLILIQGGNGDHIINGNRIAYQTGDVFFLKPSDNHTFAIEKRTCFHSLSFTELYIAGLLTVGTKPWVHLGAHTAPAPHSPTNHIVMNLTEQRMLLALVEVILAEQHSPCPLFSNPVVESLMRAILTLLDRALAQHTFELAPTRTTPSTFAQRIAAYVSRHITEPDELRMEKLADVFNYSPSHLAALFKQHMGESIQQYIIRYKLRLVETRLSLSTKTISQIADEFGFSDVCHLNKLFKRYYKHTPSDYRRSLVGMNL